MESVLKKDFYMHRYPKKQPFNSNIYIGSAQTCADTFKICTRYYQNEEFALYISRINEDMK